MYIRNYHILGFFFVIAVVLMLTSLPGCDTTPEPDWGVIWSGTVTDSAVGFAIDSAQIDFFDDYPLDTLRLPYMYTDRNGNFRFDTEKLGPFYLTVRKTGYLTQIRVISSATRKTIKGGINFKLKRSVT